MGKTRLAIFLLSFICLPFWNTYGQISVSGNSQNGQVTTTINGQNTAAGVTTLYYSKQTGQFTSFNGSYSKQTDQFENGTVTLSTSGPVTYSITPAALSIQPNQNKTWTGTVSVDPASAPAPGNQVAAAIIANYQMGYSRPYGTGTNGTVTSTYYCSSNGSASGTGGCAYHNGHPGVHEIVSDAGQQTLNFNVISIKADIPDTICLGKTAVNTVTADCYPATGGTVAWSSTSAAVQIMNPNQMTATIKLSDTTVKNAVVQVTYSIGGVSYTKQGVLSLCECSCRPITNGITAGPLSINFNAPPQSPMPDGQGNCRYNANNASFTLQMQGIINRTVNVPNGATVSFGKNCQTGTLTDVTVDWSGDIDIPELEINGVKIIKLDVTKIHLVVAANGNMSGSVTIKATNTVDRDLSYNKGFVMLRKGTNTDITFTFNNQNGFAGNWDFSGIHGINIDLVKKSATNQDVTIANFTGDMTANGVLSGNFHADVNASYSTNLFTITMLELNLGLELNVQTADFALKSGSGKVQISNMKAVTGTIDLGLAFPGNGGCTATIQASNITAFSMTLSNLSLQADFNSSFDMTKLQGSLKAKHNQFSVAIDVSQFKVEDGALTTFSASGKVTYSAFDFNLMNCTYVSTPNSQLSITAKVDINATGTQASLQVSSFTIKDDGSITVGSIAGNLNRPPAAFSFNATFGNSKFDGSFKGSFASIGLEGTVAMGAIDQPYYNYAYLSITAKTNVPLGQSGLKLTQVGGQAGFNYKLVFPGGTGQPEQNNYVVGLTLGVADVADMCEVAGNAVVQFSTFSGDVVLTLNGNINVLKNTTFFAGKVNVNYRIPQNTIDGQVGAVVKIPTDGSVITTNNCNVNFNIGNDKWSAEGKNMTGQMFGGIVQLSGGHIDMNGSLSSPTAMSGSLGGKATASFNYTLNSVGALGNSISGNIALALNSDINANINQGGLNGSFGVHVTGNGDVTVNTWVGSETFTGSADANGQIGYNGNNLSLSGTVTVTLPLNIPFWGNQITTGMNISI